ncbi:12177_t:CDS:2, partial [Entrophospora sp. SA101]
MHNTTRERTKRTKVYSTINHVHEDVENGDSGDNINGVVNDVNESNGGNSGKIKLTDKERLLSNEKQNDESWTLSTDDLQKAYIFNLDHMPNSVSENYFSSSFTNMITKGILTFEQKFSYDEGETDSLASKMVLNLNQKPTDRGIIGQKCDFHIQKDGFEYLIGLHAGGLPEACKSKKWNDRVDLAVAMRD